MYPKILLIEPSGNIDRLLENISALGICNCISTTEFSLRYPLWQNLSPHLIIVDFDYPNFNGYLFAQIVNSRNDRPRIPIVALIAADGRSEQMTAGYAVDRYLIKPITSDRLMQTIHMYLPSRS